MTTIMKMLFGLMKMVFMICWKILKIICGPMKDSLKGLGKGIWEIIKERNKKRKEEKAAAAAAAKDGVTTSSPMLPDESVRITSNDKFDNLKDDELHALLDKMTDNAVMVDANPELEKVFETYGKDQEIFKQEIMDELKRRSAERCQNLELYK